MKRMGLKNLKWLLVLIGVSACCNGGHQSPPPHSWSSSEIEAASGMCCPYRGEGNLSSEAPKGYKVFFLNHFGRHGSRYHTWDKLYSSSLDMLLYADSLGVLSDKGEEMLSLVKTIEEDSRNRIGDLSERGMDEQRGIAYRSYQRFPELFSKGDTIRCYSTKVHRTILSMTALVEELSRCNPDIKFRISASLREQEHLNHSPNAAKIHGLYQDEVNRYYLSIGNSPLRLCSVLFDDKGFIDSHLEWCEGLFDRLIQIALILPAEGYPQNINLIPWFQEEELWNYWRKDNYRLYLECGPSSQYGKYVTSDAVPLMREMIRSADKAIEGGSFSAVFRFGHDLNFVPFISLLGINGMDVQVDNPNELEKHWKSYEVSCMSTNLQMVFYKNSQGHVLVRILLNEKDAVIKELPSIQSVYYDWNNVKEYLEERFVIYNAVF